MGMNGFNALVSFEAIHQNNQSHQIYFYTNPTTFYLYFYNELYFAQLLAIHWSVVIPQTDTAWKLL